MKDTMLYALDKALNWACAIAVVAICLIAPNMID